MAAASGSRSGIFQVKAVFPFAAAFIALQHHSTAAGVRCLRQMFRAQNTRNVIRTSFNPSSKTLARGYRDGNKGQFFTNSSIVAPSMSRTRSSHRPSRVTTTIVAASPHFSAAGDAHFNAYASQADLCQRDVVLIDLLGDDYAGPRNVGRPSVSAMSIGLAVAAIVQNSFHSSVDINGVTFARPSRIKQVGNESLPRGKSTSPRLELSSNRVSLTERQSHCACIYPAFIDSVKVAVASQWK